MKKTLVALFLVTALISTIFLVGCTPAAEETPPPASPEVESPNVPDVETPEDPEEEGSVVYDAAFAYFRDFPSDNNVVAPADLFVLMDAEEDMFILDIRRAEDYEAGHLKGAVNLSFFDTSISDHIENLPDDKAIMVYCYTGQTASQVTAILNIAGKIAKNVQSGFNNGISAVEGFEDYVETDANELDTGATYAVDPAIAAAVSAYFADKMAQDGGIYANFNVTPETVNTIVEEQNDDYIILSIRRPDDYAAGHIPGATNIPYGQGMQEALSQLPADKAIVVYCYSGQTSSQTTAVLRLMGFDAYSMSGGMGKVDGSGWLGAGYEVVTE